jgi:hypothetical protein
VAGPYTSGYEGTSAAVAPHEAYSQIPPSPYIQPVYPTPNVASPPNDSAPEPPVPESSSDGYARVGSSSAAIYKPAGLRTFVKPGKIHS